MFDASRKRLIAMAGAAVMALGCCAIASSASAKDIELSFYYPVAVGGPITKIIDGYAAEFEKENPGIKINAIYAGTYQDTLVKALTAFKSGAPPKYRCLAVDRHVYLDRRGRDHAV